MVDVYLNAVGLALYGSLDPASTSAAGPFAEGTLIVKRNDAQPPFLTAMYKAKAGYDVDHADWWYGRLNEDGSSTGFTGKVDFCISCHSARIARITRLGCRRATGVNEPVPTLAVVVNLVGGSPVRRTCFLQALVAETPAALSRVTSPPGRRRMCTRRVPFWPTI